MDGPVPIIAFLLLLMAVGLVVGLIAATAHAALPRFVPGRRWPPRVALGCVVMAVPMFMISVAVKDTGIGSVPMWLSFTLFFWATLVALKLWRKKET